MAAIAGGAARTRDALLLKNYRMSKADRIDLFARGGVLGLLATYIGSAVYFLVFQTKLAFTYPKQHMRLLVVSITDLWDRLPNHLGITAGYAAAAWWVTARHDFRHVLIGFIAICLIGSITIGFKERPRASTLYMVLSVPAGLFIAIVVSTALIVFFNAVTPWMNHVGSASGNPLVNDLIGKGTIQLTIIGAVAGMAARVLVLNRTFYTIQGMSLDTKIAEGKQERWWWKIVYPPNYRKRFHYLRDSGYEPPRQNRWLGIVLALATPFLVFLLGFGIWLLKWGPAAHAGH